MKINKIVYPLLALYGLGFGGLTLGARLTWELDKFPLGAPIRQWWALPMSGLAIALGVWGIYKIIKEG